MILPIAYYIRCSTSFIVTFLTLDNSVLIKTILFYEIVKIKKHYLLLTDKSSHLGFKLHYFESLKENMNHHITKTIILSGFRLLMNKSRITLKTFLICVRQKLNRSRFIYFREEYPETIYNWFNCD